MGIDPSLLTELTWRTIGPPRGGRVVAVAGDPRDPAVFYFGACAGGVWKTDDGGTFWRNVSDGYFNTAAVGAIAVASSDPAVVYAGTGESCVRNDVSHGDGVYRSIDAGRTWQHLGLEPTRHIARVRIHPQDPDTVWVGALGDIFGPSEARGVYKTTDGGQSWKHVLFRSPRAGCSDLWLDPSNPRLLYAALWDAERKPWEMRSGGPDSSLYRSRDGGETWEDISDKPGLPQVLKGRMGICSSPAKSARIWAVIEAVDAKSGLYRSDDGGERWQRVSEEKGLLGRPWYYSHIVPDPRDAETLYSMNLTMMRSTDGGHHFTQIGTPHGDNHDLWIDPENPRRMIEGNDGGACVSYNAGASFSTTYNQPTGQFYHVDVDDKFPYRLYATQQDNSAISVPSRSRRGYISWADCYQVGFAESGHIAVDPKDNDVVFSGAVGSSGGGGGPILRYDHKTEQVRVVTIWPEYFFGEDMSAQKHRFQWTFPIAFSPHDPSVLYACGERVFRSRDDGESWESISPDLTRNDPDKQQASGGPINKDTSGAEVYCTVFAFAESLLEPGVLWAGSDDGRVHLSRDGGASWTDVTPPELGDWATVATLEPSAHDAATLYLAAHRYRLQDTAPSLWKTTDYGASWTRITEGIPDDDFTRVIRADPVRPGLLYAGTETSAYVSLDDGASWHRLDGALPHVPVYDLKLKGADLVAATHGRGFWILDDVTPLREMPDDLAASPLAVFTPPRTYRYPTPPGSLRPPIEGTNYLMGAAMDVKTLPDDTLERHLLDAGTNPRDGVTVWYHLREAAPTDAFEISFLDSDGAEIRTFSPKPDEAHSEDSDAQKADGRAADLEQRWWEVLSHEAGLQHFTWDLRCEGVRKLPDDKGHVEIATGYFVPPGQYTVQMRLGNSEVVEREFDLVKDPRLSVTDDELKAQHALLLAIRDTHNQVNEGVLRIRNIRAQLEAWRDRSDVDVTIREEATRLCAELTEIEQVLTNPKQGHPTDRLKMAVGLDGKLSDLPFAIAGADAPPTPQARLVYEKHRALAEETFARIDALAAGDVAKLGERIHAAGVPLVDTRVPKAGNRER